MKNDLIISEDKIFRIEGVIPKNPTSYIAIGDDNNNLEITFSASSKLATPILTFSLFYNLAIVSIPWPYASALSIITSPFPNER